MTAPSFRIFVVRNMRLVEELAAYLRLRVIVKNEAVQDILDQTPAQETGGEQ
jgi:hypothetical protein